MGRKTVRTMMMLVGILLIGLGVAFFRMSGFGADPFSCMNLGISGFLGLSFGNWQLIANAVLFVIVWFTVRSCVGPGTLINMVFVGYTADFVCWLVQEQLGQAAGMPLRFIYLLLGTLFLAFGCACYMVAEMGIAPYDSMTFVITKYAGEKISFRFARIASDMTAVLTGVVFCIASGNSVWQAAGLGTIVSACCNGPLIQFFRRRIQGRLGESIG